MSIPLGARIDVVCSDESHEGRTCKVTSFTWWDLAEGPVERPGRAVTDRPASDVGPRWWWDLDAERALRMLESGIGKPQGEWKSALIEDLRRNAEKLYDRAGGEELLAGEYTMDEVDAARAEGRALDVEPGSEYRSRYAIKCELCPLNLPAREEVLSPMLDKMWANGITSVELRPLIGYYRLAATEP